MCPIAETCKGMIENPLSGLVMVLLGIAFMALGILIVIWPSVSPWLAAAAYILACGTMLQMANFMRGVGTRLGRVGG